jgi:predicted amidohydrolase
MRLALANLAYPSDSVAEAVAAIEAAAGCDLVCFPECYVPGYRAPGKAVPPPDRDFLERAFDVIATAARRANVAVVLGTERFTDDGLVLTALVVDRDGRRVGFQDKVQLDASEEGPYVPGRTRRVFEVAGTTVGVTICHEGWRYPETVRFAAQHGAKLVLHPHFGEAEPGSFQPTEILDRRNTFHESAILCRAAENTVFVATVNFASAGSPTTSFVARPDGTPLAWQPYGAAGLLVAELDLTAATGRLARRCRAPYTEG